MTSNFVSDNDKLLKEWDYDKNSELCSSPFTITIGSNKKVWWQGFLGHEWKARMLIKILIANPPKYRCYLR